MPGAQDVSALTLIRDKERELAQQIHAARRRAEVVIEQAHERATTMQRRAEEEGLHEAEAYYREEIDKTQGLAAHIKATGAERARLLRKAGRAGMEDAVRLIISFVVPG